MEVSHTVTFRGICRICFGRNEWYDHLEKKIRKVSFQAMQEAALHSLNFVVRPQREFQNFNDVGRGIGNNSVVDFASTSCRIVLSQTAEKAFGRPLYTGDRLLSRSRTKKRRKIRRYRAIVGLDAVEAQFARQTARLVHEVIPMAIGDQFFLLPKLGEQQILFRYGAVYRYLNHKLNQATLYRERFLASPARDPLERLIAGLGANVTNLMFSPATVRHFFDLEQTLLKLSVKTLSKPHHPELAFHLEAVLVRAFAESVRHMEQADQFVKRSGCMTHKEQLIARTEWYKQNGVLPKGVPNPDEVRLTSDNVEQEFDKALYEYLDQFSILLLDRVISKSIKSRFAKTIYAIEGKEGLKKLISRALGDLVVKQISDPHLFTVSILFGMGIEAGHYETDGFGRGSLVKVLDVGRQMAKTYRTEGASSKDVAAVFKRSQLKVRREGYEALMQKKNAKDKLREAIHESLYSAIKGEAYRHEGVFKDVRESLSSIPLVGTATTSFHLLVNGLFYSMSYLFRSESETSTGFCSWIFRHFTGRAFSKSIANGLIGLIETPGWRFTILNCLEAVRRTIVEGEVPPPASTADMRDIISFVFRIVSKDLSEQGFPVETLFDYLVTEDFLLGLRSDVKPSTQSVHKLVMASSLPTIKEAIFVTRIVKWMRARCVWFEGDNKFWEVFVRGYLNKLVASRLSVFTFGRNPSEDKIAIRERFLDSFLDMSFDEVIEIFGHEPDVGMIAEIFRSRVPTSEEIGDLVERVQVFTSGEGRLFQGSRQSAF